MINSTRTFLIWDGCIAAIISLAFASPLYAQALGGQRGKSGPSTLNFEDLTAKAVVTTQYNTRGVLFPRGAFLDTDALARSGTRVLRAANPTKEFHAGPLVIQFTSGQRRVRLFAGMMSGSKVPGTLRAFNVSNEMVGQDVKDVAPNGFTTAFEVSADRASIVRVELQMDGDEFESIDDLEFEGATAGLLPTKPPVVQLTSPISDAQLDVSSITVQGTVSGEGLLPTATLKMQARVSPESNAPQFTTTVQLSGSATTRTFSVPISGVSLGPIELIIETRNTGGLKGVAKVKITNLPAAIRARYTAEGGVSTFGDFRWGYGFKGAVYERGAIFAT